MPEHMNVLQNQFRHAEHAYHPRERLWMLGRRRVWRQFFFEVR